MSIVLGECRPRDHGGALGAGGCLSAVAGRGRRPAERRERRPAGGARRRHGRTHRRRRRRADRLLDVRRGVLRRHDALRASACSRRCNASNEALAKGVEQNAALRGMGCTIVAAWMDDARHPLDERRRLAPAALPLSRRHPPQCRPFAGLVPGRAGAPEPDHRLSEAKQHHNRNALRSALTGSKIDLIDLRSEPLELQRRRLDPARQRRHLLARGRRDRRRRLQFPPIHARRDGGWPDRRGRAEGRRRPGQHHRRGHARRCRAGSSRRCRHDARLARREARRKRSLRSRRIGMTGRKTSIPGGRRGEPARTAIWLAAAVCVAFLCRCAHARRAVAAADDATPVRRRRADHGTGQCGGRSGPPVRPLRPSRPPGRRPSSRLPRSRLRNLAGQARRRARGGSAPRASQSKSAATPPATSPPTSSSSESEEGATPRSAPSKPAASQPAPPAASSPAPPTEEQAIAPKPAKPRTGTAKLPGPLPRHRPASRRQPARVARRDNPRRWSGAGRNRGRHPGKSTARDPADNAALRRRSGAETGPDTDAMIPPADICLCGRSL